MWPTHKIIRGIFVSLVFIAFQAYFWPYAVSFWRNRNHPIWISRQPRAMLLIAAIMYISFTFWSLVLMFDGKYSVCWVHAAVYTLNPIRNGMYVYRGLYAVVRTRRGARTMFKWLLAGKGLKITGAFCLSVLVAGYITGLYKDRDYYAFTRVKGEGVCFPPSSATVKILMGYMVLNRLVVWPSFYLLLRYVVRDRILISTELSRYLGSTALLQCFAVAIVVVKQKTKTDIEFSAYAWVLSESFWLYNSFFTPMRLAARPQKYVRVAPALVEPPAPLSTLGEQKEAARFPLGQQSPIQSARRMCSDVASLKDVLENEESYGFLLKTASTYYMEESPMFLFQVHKYMSKYSAMMGTIEPGEGQVSVEQGGKLTNQDEMFDELVEIIQDFVLPNSPYEINLEAEFLSGIQAFQNKDYFKSNIQMPSSSQAHHMHLLQNAFHQVACMLKENLDLLPDN